MAIILHAIRFKAFDDWRHPMHPMNRVRIKNNYFRRLFASDAAIFKEHLLSLDSTSRRDRFGLTVSDSFIESYVDGFWKSGDIAYGCIIDDHLRAVGELRIVNPQPGQARQAEAAFSVERAWRLAGVGTTLMRLILRAANNRRIERLDLLCLSTNRGMQSLARKFAAEIIFETDQVTGRLRCRPMTALSIWQEMIDDFRSLSQAFYTNNPIHHFR